MHVGAVIGIVECHVAAPREVGHVSRRLGNAQPAHQPGRGHHLPGDRLIDQRLGQAAERRLGSENVGEGVRVLGHQHAGAAEIIGHRQRVAADRVAVLGEVALAGLQRLVQCGADAVVEPGLDAVVEEGGGEDRDHDRGGDGDAAEQHHQAHVQPGARRAAPPLHPDARQPPGQRRAEQQQGDQIGKHQAEHPIRPERCGRATRQHREGREAEQERDRRQHQRRDLAEQDVGDPPPSGPGRALRLRRWWRRERGRRGGDVHAGSCPAPNRASGQVGNRCGGQVTRHSCETLIKHRRALASRASAYPVAGVPAVANAHRPFAIL